MKSFKGNNGLLNNKRFLKQYMDHEKWLRDLQPSSAIILEEKLLSSSFILELRKNFIEDTPVSVKKGLSKR